MTTPDTSTEAVERLAYGHDQEADYWSDLCNDAESVFSDTTAKTLRALAAERDNLSDKLELERAVSQGAHRRARAAESEVQALRAALDAVTSDLFYQIEAKHGPKVASEYPSIVSARAISPTPQEPRK